MRNKKLVLVTLVGLIFLPVFCYAAEITAEEVTPRYKKIYLDPEAERNFIERGKVKNLVAVSVGFDNNTHLNSQREGDFFEQTYYKTTWSSPWNKKVTGIAEFEIMNLAYTDESNLDLIIPAIHLGMENKINKYLTFSAGYYFDLVEYINSGIDDAAENKLEFKLTNNFAAKMYQSLLYEVSYQNFTGRHIRTAATTESDKKRDDIRNGFEYEVGKYFAKDLLKASLGYFNNNSDEQYLNYYDYDSLKLRGSMTHIFNEKIFALMSLSKQWREFRSRTITTDANFKEWDRTYLVSTALYYNLSKALTLGLNYTYRENFSNEPAENYSGSIISLGSYYRF